GDWSGIRFDSGATGSLSNMVVRYGGGSTYNGPNYAALDIATGSTQPTLANLTVSNSVTGLSVSGNGTGPTVTGSTFLSNTYGVHVTSSASPTMTGCTFTDNTNGVWGENGAAATITGGTISTSAGKRQTFLSAAGFRGTYSGATVSGTGKALIEEQSGNMQGVNAWGQVGVPYVVDTGGLTVPAGATLTVQPGVIVKFQYAPGGCCYSSAALKVQGSLVANGTTTQPIYFTSYRDDSAGGDSNGDGNATAPAARDWSGIRFDSAATGTLTNVVIRYGGGSTYNGPNYSALDIGSGTAQPVLGAGIQITDNQTGLAVSGAGTNVTISGATLGRNTTGILMTGGAVTVNGNNMLVGNTTAIRVDAGLPTISGNTFTGNQTAIVLNGGTGTLNANSILGNGTGIEISGSGTNPLIIANILAGNNLAIHTLNHATPLIHNNDIAGNTFGLQNDDASVTVDATVNYWGASNGPSQAGSGAGDKVSGSVNFTPFLTTANGTNTNQFQILLITPSRGGNAGSATVQVYGTGFQSGATLKLTAPGQPDLVGSNTTVANLGFTLSSTVNLVGAAPGLRDVVVSNPGGASTTLPGAFTVELGGSPNIVVSLVGRNVMRAAQPQSYFINVTNNGNIDGAAVRVWIGFPSYVQWQSPQPPGSSGQLSGTTYVAFDVSKVPAGSSFQVPILLTAPDNPIYAHQRFQVQVWGERQ
ncbi:MAG: hypothetical protein JST11_19180, partial [Acidobacteria bacterium]|nr:hypothetical protein [Acidobacteriota bacterium]